MVDIPRVATQGSVNHALSTHHLHSKLGLDTEVQQRIEMEGNLMDL